MKESVSTKTHTKTKGYESINVKENILAEGWWLEICLWESKKEKPYLNKKKSENRNGEVLVCLRNNIAQI